MSLNSATIEFLLGKGLTGEDLLVVARSLEASRPRTKAAERQARYRKRKEDESVTNDVTNDVTDPPIDNNHTPRSVSNDTGGPAADPVKELFDLGVSILTSTGTGEKQARSLLGKWRKAKGEAAVLQALLDCRARSISNPVEWIEARFKSAKYVSASGYEYRGTEEQILKEAERRGDNNTYWAVKTAMKTRAA